MLFSSRVLLSMLALLLLSSCAPVLMSEDRFPIKPGITWIINYTGSPKVSKEFVLGGKPTREADYVLYEGSAGANDIVAAYTKNDVLLVIVDLDNQPEKDRKRLHCYLINDYRTAKIGEQNFNLWSGNGFVGTDEEYKALPSKTMSSLYYESISCSVRPK